MFNPRPIPSNVPSLKFKTTASSRVKDSSVPVKSQTLRPVSMEPIKPPTVVPNQDQPPRALLRNWLHPASVLLPWVSLLLSLCNTSYKESVIQRAAGDGLQRRLWDNEGGGRE